MPVKTFEIKRYLEGGSDNVRVASSVALDAPCEDDSGACVVSARKMLNMILTGFLISAGLGVEHPAPAPYDNDCVARHMALMKPVARQGTAQHPAGFDAARISHGDIGFDELSAFTWAQDMLSAEGLSTRGLRVDTYRAQGCRNLGVFAIHTAAGSYFAKRTNRMFEPVRLATLQMHLQCYSRESDVRDRNPYAVWMPGDEARRARVMPLLAWDYALSDGDERLPPFLPTMLFEHARGAPLDVPDPDRLDDYTPEEEGAFLRRAYALGVSLALLQVPGMQGSSRAHVFERTAWVHDDLHLHNMFFDEDLERIEMVDCIEMRRSSQWHNDLRALLLHRDLYPVEHPLRQAWSLQLAEGYLSRTSGLLQRELRNAFAGTLIYSKPDFHDVDRRALIW